MNGRRLFAIGVILALAAGAWFVLAGSVQLRSDGVISSLGSEVAGLWGSPQIQSAPVFTAKAATVTAPVELAGSDITADFKLDQRRRGLMWYATYVVDFSGTYRVSNPTTSTEVVTMTFTFPDSAGIYDGFAVSVAGAEVPVKYDNGQAVASFTLAPKSAASVGTKYRTNGMDRWAYQPSPAGVGVMRDFRLRMNTNFGAIDFPEDGVSPTSKTAAGDGWTLEWKYDSVVSGRSIGLVMPKPMNPGPLVSRITAFAPVSLLFFFAALVLLTATSGLRLHPVHYGFLAAAFFAFDLLLAYLADRVDINVAFAIGAVTSVALVLGYLRTVVGWNRALVEIAISQFVFLVLFAYSFFFEGLTGLAITVGSVLTLAFFMAKTAHVDWETVFVPRQSTADRRVPAVDPPAPGNSAPSAFDTQD